MSEFPGISPAGPVKPGTVVVDQMYVHYRIPASLKSDVLPIVLVHGGGLTGASYETTPDGREGWATYFARKGYAVYVVDTPGRGDHLDAPVFTGRPRYEARKSVVQRINRNDAGRATLMTLPELGIRGNSHMMMQDTNNLQVADVILDWLSKNTR